MPDTDAGAEDAGSSDNSTSNNETSEDPRENLPQIGDSYAGLRWVSSLEPTSKTDTSEDALQETPDIDVVHVLGVRGDQGRLDISGITSWKAAKRQLVFESDILGLINDDVEFTSASIEDGARCLLAGLRHFRQLGIQPPKRGILVIAYDLGALFLKKAVSISALNEAEWPGVFTSVGSIVFSGCFHRTDSKGNLGRKIYHFLQDYKKDNDWERFLTPTSVTNLITTSFEVNSLFLRSKVTLRSRIFSLYVGDKGKRIHEVFDYFTATLGVPTELSISEEDNDADNEAFPSLAKMIRDLPDHAWIPEPSRTAMELTLMSLVPEPVRMISKCQSKDDPVFSNVAYEDWRNSSTGTRILYLQGPDRRATTEVAEHIYHECVRRQLKKDSESPQLFAFSFSSSDPFRNSMRTMLTAKFLHYHTREPSDSDQRGCDMLQDHYTIQNAWTEEDLIKLTYLNVDERRPSLLLNLDECEARGRKAFWAFLGESAMKIEGPFKFIVTSNKSEALQDEMGRWPDLHVHDYNLPDTGISMDAEDEEYLERMTARLSPKRLGETEIRKCLERLKLVDRQTLDEMIHLLEIYTRWPAEMNSKNLALFCSLLEDITPTSKPRDLLRTILLSKPNRTGLRWLLTWTLYGKRPLSLPELSTVLYSCSREVAPDASPPGDSDIESCSRSVEDQLRGFLHQSNDQVYIHADVLGLMDDDPEQIWSEVKKSAPEATARFLLGYLSSPEVQRRLEAFYHRYQVGFKTSGRNITPPIVPDGRDAIYYAVEALPYHLSGIDISDEVRNQMEDPCGPYMPWAKMYWAMSNPFSRAAKGHWKSAWATWEAAPESGLLNLVKSQPERGDKTPERPKYHAIDNTTETTQPEAMDKLIEAVKVGKEDLALHFANQLIADAGTRQQSGEPGLHNTQIQWPSTILWRATWLDMYHLMDLLLNNGMRPDDNSSGFSPSPLYTAARLGHLRIVEMLLMHGADHRMKRIDQYTPLYTACAHGHTAIIRTLLKKDRSQLDVPQPRRPLYCASVWGAWKTVEALLQMHANPNLLMKTTPSEGADWSPIAAACDDGYDKTVRSLLEHGADPNTTGPRGLDTPLWYAAVRSASVECVQLLLEHGADPNHELLQPPLLNEIIWEDGIPIKTKIAIFDLLLSNDPPVLLEKAHTDGTTALMAASKKGDAAIVRWLLDHSARVNIMDQNDCHALWYASVEGHKPVVHELLNHKEASHMNIICGHKWIFLGAVLGNAPLAKTLLDAGADPNLVDDNQHTLLTIAAMQEDVGIVKVLLEPERKTDIHHREAQGWSPILIATGIKPNVEVARMLMESGAKLSDKSPYGSSPLHLATYHARPDILRILLEFHAYEDLERRDSNGNTPLVSVTKFEDPKCLECIRLLVRAGSDVNAQNVKGCTILLQCASRASVPDAEAIYNFLLMLPKVDINLVLQGYGTALHMACRKQHMRLITRLLEYGGVDVNLTCVAYAGTPLIAACIPFLDSTRDAADIQENQERIVRELIANGANVDVMFGPSVFNVLCAASLSAGVATVNYLLDKSSSVKRPDPLGRLPIHFAAANGIRNFETVALIHGDNIMVPDIFKKSALHWASQFGHVETVQAILQRLSATERKEYVNAADVDGWTPLVWTTRPDLSPPWITSEPQDYAATIECLIDHGANVDVRFVYGQGETAETLTPLEMAKRCAADDDVLRLLCPEQETDNKPIEDEGSLKYKESTYFCDMCLSSIYGIIYICDDCDYEYSMCKKCYNVADQGHSRISTDSKPHNFHIREGRESEFEGLAPVSAGLDPVVTSPDQAFGEDAPVEDVELLQPDERDDQGYDSDSPSLPTSDHLEGTD